MRKVSLVLQHPVLAIRRALYNTWRNFDDRCARMGYYPYPFPIMFHAGLSMGGSSWMKNLLGQIPGYYDRPLPPALSLPVLDYDDASFVNVPDRCYSYLKTHMNPKQENLDVLYRNGVKKILITHRDLRDVAVARYYRLLAQPKPGYASYAHMSKAEGLAHSISFVGSHHKVWIDDWFKLAGKNTSRFKFITFEELKADTVGTLKSVLMFFGISLPDRKIRRIVSNAQGRGTLHKNLIAAKVLPFGVSSTFRSGEVGSWKHEFDQYHIEQCKDWGIQ